MVFYNCTWPWPYSGNLAFRCDAACQDLWEVIITVKCCCKSSTGIKSDSVRLGGCKKRRLADAAGRHLHVHVQLLKRLCATTPTLGSFQFLVTPPLGFSILWYNFAICKPSLLARHRFSFFWRSSSLLLWSSMADQSLTSHPAASRAHHLPNGKGFRNPWDSWKDVTNADFSKAWVQCVVFAM